MSDDMQLEEVNQTESPAEETSNVEVESPDEWSSLDGKSQERFQKLANLKREAEKQAEQERVAREKLEARLESLEKNQRIPMPRTNQMTDEEQRAYKRLQELGVANQNYVDRKVNEKLKAIEDRMYFDGLHNDLARDINSQSGLPKYDREEIEKEMKRTQNWNPRAVYRDLYHDEIVAYEAGKLTSKKKKTVQTEGTKSRIGTQQPWTKESLAERLRQPDGKQFFIKNREKILKMQGQLE